MLKIFTYITTMLFALAAIVSLWFLLNNLQPLSPGLYSFAVICVCAVIILFVLFGGSFRTKVAHFSSKILSIKHFTLIVIPVIIFLGIAVRLYFYFHFSYTPISDPITFFEAGQKIAAGGGLHGDSYAAFFPYLASYNAVLGFAMAFIHNSWLATMVLNTIFDIGAAFAIFFTVRKITKSRSQLPTVAFALWLLSPFNILFSVISIPIIIVNFFICVAILLVFLLIDSLKERRFALSLVLGALIGITISVGNAFRPVFIIVIVALFLVFIYLLLTSKDRPKLLTLLIPVFILIVGIFLGGQRLDLSLVANATGLQPASSSSGWSIFVGANSGSNGKWNQEDQNRMDSICVNTKSYNQCHEKLRDAGVKRYKDAGITGTVNLFIRKLYVFSSNQSNVYNANLSIDNYADSTSQKLFNIYLTVFTITLFFLSFRFFYQAAKDVRFNYSISPDILFIALLLIGFFISAMLVEVSERYAQILYPLFIVAATFGLGSWKLRSIKKK